MYKRQVPGLSDADQQRYKEIVANETRQREYAQGRGKEWDAAQAAQASNAVAALKQMYDCLLYTSRCV